MIPIRLGKKVVTALLDIGSSISLVRAHLVPQDQPVLRYTTVYRQVCRWPVVRMSVGYNVCIYSMDILKVDDLLFPVSLGCDIVLKNAIETSSIALSDDDTEAGPSGVDNDDDLVPGATGWSVDTDFQEAQMTDPTLEPARRLLAVKEDVVTDPRRARRLPHFEQVRGIFWWEAAAEKGGGTL